MNFGSKIYNHDSRGSMRGSSDRANECYKMLNEGTLKGYRVGKTWRIPKENVLHYIRSKTIKK